MNPTLEDVTERIRKRSEQSRATYLRGIDQAAAEGPHRNALSCGNLAHGMAACGADSKQRLTEGQTPNIAIVSAYNDMLSAHQPYEGYPEQIRRAALTLGATAQMAGGVPAMCDGVTQGRPGMELSLFSRDVIAMSTAIALTHDMFDGAMCLGVCDKIVPGLLIGALSFGHLPVVFVPAGPMPSGLPNKEKVRVREAYAAGEVGRDALIAAESASYHSPGTCTFYGTANSNQMLLEFMGLQLPGSSFVNPDDPLRPALTHAATQTVLSNTRAHGTFRPLGHMLDERSLVNAIVGLHATGGSTNHTIHLLAIARAAGIQITWQDFSDLAAVVPLMAQVYPNGSADVNHFHAAGGLGYMIGSLLAEGLLHEDVDTILGRGLQRFSEVPKAAGDGVQWQAGPDRSGDLSVLRPASDPFQATGGLVLLKGEIGQGVAKISAVAAEHHSISAPARVFFSQEDFVAAFEAGELNQDVVAVVAYQGPSANGMPELHKLSPYLGTLQNRGYRVALLTDGRMSGASGKVLGAIQVSPEAARGGLIARVQDGDMIHIDAAAGSIKVDADLDSRPHPAPDLTGSNSGLGRDLFAGFRQTVGGADSGGSVFAGGAL